MGPLDVGPRARDQGIAAIAEARAHERQQLGVGTQRDQIGRERGIARYLTLAFLLGQDFDARPGARAILTDASMDAEMKLKRLMGHVQKRPAPFRGPRALT